MPREFAPSKKVTEPLARSPLKEGWTAAVRVTLWPKGAGFWLEAMETVEAAGFTVTLVAAEVLAEKFASPLYVAVMVCVPPWKPASSSVA